MHGYHVSNKQEKRSRRIETRVKQEKNEIQQPEVSEQTLAVDNLEKDLTHYVKDRVELMKQVFVILKDRELMAMAPDCLRSLKLDDVQELCLDEVLGISSKRLHSILDGFECPSDTDSSQGSVDLGKKRLQDFETISLDSISSEEDQISKPKKRSHHHGRRKNKIKGDRLRDGATSSAQSAPVSTSGTAGMTVLELLELQARARAIRAQLQAVHANIDDTTGDELGAKSEESASADEVVIKEEPQEVVELVSSTDEDVPNKAKRKSIEANQRVSTASKESLVRPSVSTSTLVITMPEVSQQPSRKIKLKRNNVLVSMNNSANVTQKNDSLEKTIELDKDESKIESEVEKGQKKDKIEEEKPKTVEVNKDISIKVINTCVDDAVNIASDVVIEMEKNPKTKKSKKVIKRRRKTKSKASDEDEIMLELSDTEKMDLFDSFNSDVEADDESISSADEDKCDEINENDEEGCKNTIGGDAAIVENQRKEPEEENIEMHGDDGNMNEAILEDSNTKCISGEVVQHVIDVKDIKNSSVEDLKNVSVEDIKNSSVDIGIEVHISECDKKKKKKSKFKKSKKGEKKKLQNNPKDLENFECKHTDDIVQAVNKNDELSEGECSYSSDGIEITEVEHDIVCITESSEDSLEENGKPKKKKYRKHKSESSDESKLDLETFEISDDSSADEELNCLSKEPTTAEILELSKKIDTEIEREDIVFEDRVMASEDNEMKKRILKSTEAPDTSWKERWLKSDRVQRVLVTSNLCNAIRKKNKELKLKLGEDSGDISEETERAAINIESNVCEDQKNDNSKEVGAETEMGSVNFYMTLQSSTRFVDPVKNPEDEKRRQSMAKDARQLMKMYKKLLKLHKTGGKKKKKKKDKELER